MSDDVTPLGAIGRGLVAGFVATAAMTAWQLLPARLQSSGGEPGGSSPEPKDPWEEASAPAKLARLVIEGVFSVDQGKGGEVPVVLFQHFRRNLDNWEH